MPVDEPELIESLSPHSAELSWHVSQWLSDGHAALTWLPTGVPSSGSPSGGSTASDPEPTARRPTLPPLWKRIATGQSLGWRIRRARRAVIRARRRAVTRVMSWFQRNPEIVRSLEAGRLVDAARATRRSLVTSRLLAGHDRAGTVEISADLADVSTDHPLLRSASVVPVSEPNSGMMRIRPTFDGCAEPTLVLGSDRSIAVHRDGQQFDVVAPFDVKQWNPIAFPLRPTTGPLMLRDIIGSTRPSSVHRQLAKARRAESVRCAASDDGAPAGVAARIVDLAAAGVVLVGQVDLAVAPLIGEHLTHAIGRVESTAMSDLRERELQSVRLRRIAHREFSVPGRWRTVGELLGGRPPSTPTPTVSVLLASNRPADVVGAARQVAAQVDVDVQLIVGLHGAHMPAGLGDEVRDSFPGDVHVEHFPDELALGEVLAALTTVAGGEYVTKWDDDDWYGVDHLADLVRAHRYSGAVLVGKAAEFVRLEGLDITIRRFARGSETYSTTIAGGTLLTLREALQEVGWAPHPRQVDRRLIEAMGDRGWTTYRTHGFGYVLRRRQGGDDQHTWQASDAYFLGQSAEQWPGLALVESDVASGADPGIT